MILSVAFLIGAQLVSPSQSGEIDLHDPEKNTEEIQTVRRLDRLDEQKLAALIHNRNGRALFINVWAT